MRHTALDLTADIIDVRDIIERYEELDEERAACTIHDADADELHSLQAILDELRGNNGDEQWRGDWFPVMLIRESYFKTYAQELADDIGAIPSNAQWPLTCIDWEQAARELRMDYSSIDINGVTYWYR